MVNHMPSREPASVEQSLVECVSRGEWLDLAADDEAVDEAAMRSWADSRTCRASRDPRYLAWAARVRS